MQQQREKGPKVLRGGQAVPHGRGVQKVSGQKGGGQRWGEGEGQKNVLHMVISFHAIICSQVMLLQVEGVCHRQWREGMAAQLQPAECCAAHGRAREAQESSMLGWSRVDCNFLSRGGRRWR